MSWSYDSNTKVITQSGRDYDLSGLAGSVITDSFTLAVDEDGNTPASTTVKIMAKEGVLSSAVTLTGDGSSDIDALITAHNNANAGSEVVLASGDGGQKLESGQTIVIPAGMTGVEVDRDAYSRFSDTGPSEVVTYKVDNETRINVTGTLFHDPEVEILILTYDYPSNTEAWLQALSIGHTGAAYWVSSWSRDSEGRLVGTYDNGHPFEVGDVVNIRNAGSLPNNRPLPVAEVTETTVTLECTQFSTEVPSSGRLFVSAAYNYGKYTEGYGRKRTSNACGLMFTGKPKNYFQEQGAGLSVGGTGGFIGRGGIIMSTKNFALYGVVDLIDTSIVCTTRLDTRGVGGGRFRNTKWIGFQPSGIFTQQIVERGIVLQQSSLMEVLSDPFFEIVLKDFDASSNINGTDIAHSPDNNYRHRDWIVVNSANGSNVRGMWRQGAGSQKGNLFVKKEVSFNFEDASGNPLSGVELYLQDNPSDYAKNATFAEPNHASHKYTQTSYTDKQNGETLGVLNSDGTVTYDYTGVITYSGTSDAQGNIDTIKVLTAATILEYNSGSAHATAAKNDYPGLVTNSSGTWRTLNPTTYPALEDWDTDKWGGFYKVDRRSNSNTDADDFTFKFCSYGHALSSTTQELKGLGELEVNWVLFDDLNIVDSKASVEAYTEISSPQEFYDAAKLHLVNNFAGETSTIVNRAGNKIDAGSYNVHINKDATDVFAFDGTTITIKTDQFIGDIVTTGTTTVESDEVVVGNFGSIGVLPWEIKNIEATSRIQLYNVTQSAEVLTTKLNGTAGALVDTDGTYTSGEIAVGDVVRLRVTCVVGAEAMLPLEVTGVATTAGLNFSIDQQADTIYNINGIDGSAISTWTADFTNNPMGVDLSESDGGATVQEIYAFMVYSQTTADGVDKWFNVITAIDGSNYQIDDTVANIKIQNRGSVAVNISGGRIFRKDGASVLYAEDGDKPLTLDTGALVANIQPQMETVINNNAKISSINNNSKLIPGLL